MNYKQHVLFGTALCVGFQALGYMDTKDILAYPAFYAGGALGSLLPDIDHPKSFLGSKIPILPKFIYATWGHRSITHSLPAVLTLGIATAFTLHAHPYFLLGNFIGFISHLLGDMLTPQGIPLFWPEKKRYRIFPLIRSHK